LETNTNLVLPNGLKDGLEGGFYITRGFDRNIMVLTMQAFQSIYVRITSQNLADPVARLLLRMILGTAYQTQVTATGTIEISSTLSAYANIDKDVVLVGQGDYIELWSPKNWNKQVEQLLNVDPNYFSNLNISTQ
jgi:MraZ protein